MAKAKARKKMTGRVFIRTLQLLEWNPNLMDEDERRRLQTSIEQHSVAVADWDPADGFRLATTITVNRNGRRVIGGAHRIEAIGALGQKWIHPDDITWVTVEPDSAREKSLNVSLNNPTSQGMMDGSRLEPVLQDIRVGDPELFAQLELDCIPLEPVVVDRSGGATDPNAMVQTPKKPVSKRGAIYRLGKHRMMCGDATKKDHINALFGRRTKADLLVTSPPYNQRIDKFKPSGMHREGNWVEKVGKLAYDDCLPEKEYQASQSVVLGLWFDVLSDGASAFYNHKNRYRGKQLISPLQWLPGPFKLRQEIIWARPGSVTQNARMFLPCDERIYWLYKGVDFTFNDTTEIKSWSSIWKIQNETNKSHAVGFPVELPIRCISACTKSRAVVADPYLGSGTTLIACEQLNRRCYGMEIDPRCCDVSRKRWAEFVHGEGANWRKLTKAT